MLKDATVTPWPGGPVRASCFSGLLLTQFIIALNLVLTMRDNEMLHITVTYRYYFDTLYKGHCRGGRSLRLTTMIRVTLSTHTLNSLPKQLQQPSINQTGSTLFIR